MNKEIGQQFPGGIAENVRVAEDVGSSLAPATGKLCVCKCK